MAAAVRRIDAAGRQYRDGVAAGMPGPSGGARNPLLSITSTTATVIALRSGRTRRRGHRDSWLYRGPPDPGRPPRRPLAAVITGALTSVSHGSVPTVES